MTSKSTPRGSGSSAGAIKPASRSFDASLVRELAEIIAETGLTEIEVEHQEMRVRVARMPAPQTVHAAVSAAPAAATPAAPPQSAPALTTPASSGTLPASRAAAPAGAVASPMVGTVYLSADPDKPAFVTVGKTVREGETLLLIEAMKTFNPIPAPRAGTVVEILVSDAEPVEFGQPLVVIG